MESMIASQLWQEQMLQLTTVNYTWCNCLTSIPWNGVMQLPATTARSEKYIYSNCRPLMLERISTWCNCRPLMLERISTWCNYQPLMLERISTWCNCRPLMLESISTWCNCRPLMLESISTWCNYRLPCNACTDHQSTWCNCRPLMLERCTLLSPQLRARRMISITSLGISISTWDQTPQNCDKLWLEYQGMMSVNHEMQLAQVQHVCAG